MVVSRAAKESRIYAHTIIKNATTVRIYTHDYTCCMAKCHFFLCILIKGIPCIPLKFPLRIEFTFKSEASSITQRCLLYLQHNFWLITIRFVAAKFLTTKTYQLFFSYISWNKYRHTPVPFMIVLFSKNAS